MTKTIHWIETDDPKRVAIIKKMIRHVNGLNAAMEELRQIDHEANYYLEDANNFCVMSGPSYTEDLYPKAQQQNMLALLNLYHSSGGAW